MPLPGQKKPVVHPRQRGLEVEFKAIIEKEDLRYFSTRCREAKNQNSCFSCDVTAAMLVYRTILGDVTATMLVYTTVAKKSFFGTFDSIIMPNLSDVWPLFCAPIWPSRHVSDSQE